MDNLGVSKSSAPRVFVGGEGKSCRLPGVVE